jgi:hypothetical protein
MGKKILGAFLVASPFIAIFIIALIKIGLLLALAVFLIVALVVVVITEGVYLLTK